MINVQEASELIRQHIRRNPVEECALEHLLGKVLAQTIKSKEPSPRFDASSVDGYAVSLESFKTFSSDKGLILPIVAEIQAGDNTLRNLPKGKSTRIFTGGRVPKGANAVVMQEYVNRKGNEAHFATMPRAEENVRRLGAEFSKGTTIFEKGILITPSVVSTIAALGYEKVKVYRQPRVSVVVSGDEVRPPGTTLARGEIYDSNSFALQAALSGIGIDEVKVFHVRDNLKKTTDELRKALIISDFVIVTGGVSVGDHDYVREALSKLEVKEIFWQVKVKPGKPLLFGKKLKKKNIEEKYVFGLPGNPVSVLVTFHLFVREALLQSMGFHEMDKSFICSLAAPIKKAAGRAEYVRGKLLPITKNMRQVLPLMEQESNMTSGLARADCLIEFPEVKSFLSEGEEVRVIPIQWSLF